MKKSKINVEHDILNMIANSTKLTESQKISFLKFIWYMNKKEIDELKMLV